MKLDIRKELSSTEEDTTVINQLVDADLQSLIYLTPFGLPEASPEGEHAMKNFVLRALELSPNGLTEETMDHLYELVFEIQLKQGLMRAILDGYVDALGRDENGAMRYQCRTDAPATTPS